MSDREMYYKVFCNLTRISVVICLIVVILGAFVRLSNAGLGCPDWPGCYGQLFSVPETATEISTAEQNYQRPVETDKAWKEMIHRYLAGILGLLIFTLTVIAVTRWRYPRQPVKLPLLISVLVIFQALLGMWTVTWLLAPIVVTTHLLGGMMLLSLLWWLTLKTFYMPSTGNPHPKWALSAAIVGIVLLGGQIASGGWVSANYAALACPDFPTCHQQWWPTMDFKQAFTLNWEENVNYEFGTLDNPARTAIHMTHRIGAIVIALTLGIYLVMLCLGDHAPRVKKIAAIALSLLAVQISLGISNIIFYLPLAVANAHNAGAALLLIAMVTLLYMLKFSPENRK